MPDTRAMQRAGARKVSWSVLMLTAALSEALMANAIGISRLTDIERLPYLLLDVQVRYEGSIDKAGDNADFNWWLYQDDRGEWVIFDVDGPGCIYNFVVHHDQKHSDPIYRFYFDGAAAPAFEIRHSEFGSKFPFVEPLAASYDPRAAGCPDARLGEIDFRIVRSFCPMPFARSCKVTSSIRLQGSHPGGWGHIMYHAYPATDRVATFRGTEDYAPLLKLWRNVGEDPKRTNGNVAVAGAVSVAPGQSTEVFRRREEGSIASIKLHVPHEPMRRLQDLWIGIRWDDEADFAVDCPVGAFFGNELGLNSIRYLTHGMTTNGDFYCYFPMPYWRSAQVVLRNQGSADIRDVRYEIQYKPAAVLRYPRCQAAHFRASAYQPPVRKEPARDSHIAMLAGRGHLVAGLVTGRDTSCEGDVRVLIDEAATPSVESDGSESWACYGWGFVNPPRSNPVSGFDGTGNGLWSMTRICLGDCYPFRTALRFSVEGGAGRHQGTDIRSGIVFYYGEAEPGMVRTDSINVGDAASEAAHAYVATNSEVRPLAAFYEGECDQVEVKDQGRYLQAPGTFNARISPDNGGVLLRRRSDQQLGRQRARVFVDGAQVRERDWYYADRNPHKRWLDDEFLIPQSYTAGKAKITVRIEPAVCGGETTWNEFFYWVYSLRGETDAGVRNDRR